MLVHVFRESRRRRRRALLHALLVGSVALALPAAGRASPGLALPPHGAVTLGTEVRDFDGLRADILTFRGPTFRFTTDSLRAWAPRNGVTSGDVLVFEHQQLRGVTLELYAIASRHAIASERAWKSYVRDVTARLGEQSRFLEHSDSSSPTRSVALLGWPTNEALFSYPGPSGEMLGERHMIASTESGGIVLIISGPIGQVLKAGGDLRLLAARCERE